MAVAELVTRRREPYLDGQPFGPAGAYERIDGVLRYAAPRGHPANARIADLDLAAYDADGRVRFEGDVCLLIPADAARGNRRLLVELPNRGRKLVPRHFNRAPVAVPPTAEIPPGDGFLLRRGWSLAWVGWQWDVIRSDALMGLEAPQAIVDGHPARGTTVVRFQPNERHRTHLLADRVHHPMPAFDLDERDAALTVREHNDDAPRVIPRDRWRFASDRDGAVVPDAEHVHLAEGFEPGLIYELTYTTGYAPVVGTGLLAARDAAAFLRYDRGGANPLAGAVDYVYGFGMSQTGRMLRHFLWLGLNLDEAGRQVYDGLLPHVAGARRGEFNHRFGQPSVQATPNVGHLPPFDDAGLFARQRALGGMPKVVQTNSSAEYWRGDCALAHIDVDGARDLEADPDGRFYLFAGTQHGPGGLPLTRHNPNDGSRAAHGFNCVDYTPLLRAALVNLDQWVSEGAEPPPSAHPRLADATAVSRSTAIAQLPSIPGLWRPDPERVFGIRRVDAGPDAGRGVVRVPVVEGAPYPTFVAAVDVDGNELAGIRLPDLTVPVGTHLGWNPRDPETGAPEQIIPMQGSTFFFSPDAVTREQDGDQRPSLAERYASRDDYLLRVRHAALGLAAERHILDEDVTTVVDDNAARFDAAWSGTA